MTHTCSNCGASSDEGVSFCTTCGTRLPGPAAPTEPDPPETAVASPPTDPSDAHTQRIPRQPTPPPAQQPYTPPQYTAPQQQPYAPPHAQAPPPPPPPPGVPMPYYAQYPQPVPRQASGSNRGLIIGLSAALAVALAGVVAAVLLASGGSDGSPTVASAATALDTTPQTVTTVEKIVTAKPKHHKKKPSSGRVATPVSNPTTTQHPAATSAIADKAEIRGVVTRHWAEIESGNYSAAFDLLAPGSQSRSAWISAHEQDALTSESVSLGSPTITSATSATVPVINLHTVAASGCFDWSGHYEMTKVDGSWKISKAKISNSSC